MGDCSASLRGMGWSPVRPDGVTSRGGPSTRALTDARCDCRSRSSLLLSCAASTARGAPSSHCRRPLLTAPFTIPRCLFCWHAFDPAVVTIWPQMVQLWAQCGLVVAFIWAPSGLGFRGGRSVAILWPRCGQTWALCGLRLTMTVRGGQPWPVSDLSVARSGLVVGRFWPRHRKKEATRSQPGRLWAVCGLFVARI